MLEVIAAHIQSLPLAVQMIGVAVLLAIADFVLGTVRAVANSELTFSWALLSDWIRNKGLPLVTIAVLFGLDAAFDVLSIDVGDTNLGAFGILAYGQLGTFIASEAASVLKNATSLTGGTGTPPTA